MCLQEGRSVLPPGITQEKGKRFKTSKGLSSPDINSNAKYLSPMKYLNYYFILRNYQEQLREGLGNRLLAKWVTL